MENILKLNTSMKSPFRSRNRNSLAFQKLPSKSITKSHKKFLLCVLPEVLCFSLRIMINLELYCIWCEVWIKFHIFAQYEIFPAPFIENAVLYSLNCLCKLFKNQLNIYVWICFWTLYSVPWIYMSVLTWMPHCHAVDYCSFINLKASCCYSSNFVLFPSCFGYSKLFTFQYEF